jgi:hypothetical protein
MDFRVNVKGSVNIRPALKSHFRVPTIARSAEAAEVWRMLVYHVQAYS